MQSKNQEAAVVIKLIRTDRSSPKQILGMLITPTFSCYTLELPWIDNAKGKSCIPEGRYHWRKRQPYGGFPYVHIDILDVPGRSGIKIHTGNYYTQIEGCILVGNSLADINHDGVRDVVNSRKTLALLIASLPNEGEIIIE